MASKKSKRGKHKSHKVKELKPESKEKFNNIRLGIFVIALLLFIFGMIWYNSKHNPESFQDEVIAKVNGHPIYLSKINKQYYLIPESLRDRITKEDVLNKTIKEELLLEEAKKLNLDVNDSEVNDLIDRLMAYGGINDQQLDERLKQYNITRNELFNVYKKELIINKLLNKTVFSLVKVSNKEIEMYYEEHLNNPLIKQPKMVRVAHILVNNSKLATQILQEIKNGSNFSILAMKYSIDNSTASKGGDLGYFPKGVMVKEFNEAVFNMSIDEYKIIKTRYGYHIVHLIDIKNESYRPLKDVRDTINKILIQKKRNEMLLKYLDSLKKQAQIVIYWDKLKASERATSFQDTGDKICTKDGKPIIRVFTSSTCPHCKWAKPIIDPILKRYINEGKIIAYHWQFSSTSTDNLLTAGQDAMPKEELKLYKKYDPQGYVPFYLFGCKYARIGNRYEAEDNKKAEEEEFRKAIEQVIRDSQPKVKFEIK